MPYDNTFIRIAHPNIRLIIGRRVVDCQLHGLIRKHERRRRRFDGERLLLCVDVCLVKEIVGMIQCDIPILVVNERK